MTSASNAEESDGRDDPVRIGDVIASSYVTESVLGRGASGVVYLAKRRGEAERVALKVIFPEHCHSRQIFGRYKREAAILRRIGGDHIVRFLDFVEHDGLLAIALEHVQGTSLERVLEESPMELQRAMVLCSQICAGLSIAHQAGVVHRDLKPANVMVELKNECARARILDFGLAKVVHGEHLVTGLTERDMIFGTPEYMAPEQARGDEVDVRCDVYALGVILYEMTTGSVPHKGRTPLATMTAQLIEQVIPPRERAPDRDIPPAVEAVIMRALDKDPAGRYPSAEVFADALDAALERRVISVNFKDSAETAISDTELNLRRSQIHPTPQLLADAERLAAANAKKRADPAEIVAAEVPPSSLLKRQHREQWSWIVGAAIAVVICVAVGVALALIK